MIRIVCQEVGVCPSGDVTDRTIKTFDIDAPELEAWLTEERGGYCYRSQIGCEVIAEGTG